jgi:hypothetical protein
VHNVGMHDVAVCSMRMRRVGRYITGRHSGDVSGIALQNKDVSLSGRPFRKRMPIFSIICC